MTYPDPYNGPQQPDWRNSAQAFPEFPATPGYPDPNVPPGAAYPPAAAYPVMPYGQPVYGAPVYGVPGFGFDPAAPYGRDPYSGEPLSDKSKISAGMLQLFLGGFGAGRFYLGHNGIAIAQLITLILGWLLAIIVIGYLVLLGLSIWVFIDAIMMFTGGVRDSRGFKLRN
ncbi:TM2 domain-containing protein [Nocardia sp. 348MFTsu5.1]|uniref:TM2 domain-containing protein n=1 Tax=Nocardia sp. 348MFTsu5.1 TaxID=1172185 RepID=UPI00039DF31F|nr:TM2 domain-containing protein [Nocardia sp. 348MFTsu5.1]